MSLQGEYGFLIRLKDRLEAEANQSSGERRCRLVNAVLALEIATVNLKKLLEVDKYKEVKA